MHRRISYNDFLELDFSRRNDLTSAALGSSVIAVTDEFFGSASNMINPLPPKHFPTGFAELTLLRRRHLCVIKLGYPGSLSCLDIDTRYFIHNQSPVVAVDATFCPDGDAQDDDVIWTEVLPKVEILPDDHNVFILPQSADVYTHIRINNIPDGGITRFHAFGTISPVWPKDVSAVSDLASVGSGGRVVHVTDQHYTPGSNLLLPGRGITMNDGWQTARSRAPDHADYVIIRLGDRGHILKIEIDTSHFKGNYPSKIMLEATNTDNEIPDSLADWTVLLNRTSVGPHGLFYFDTLVTDKAFSHAKLSIFPDGGLKRVRLWGVRAGAVIPSLPITLPSVEKTQLIAESLTADAYGPYGDVIEAISSNVTGANQGTAKKYHHVAEIVNIFPNGNGYTNMCVFRCSPATQLPFVVKLLERHPYSSQFFVPMTDGNTRGYLVIVALNGKDDKPDMSTMKAFIATSKQGVNYRQGTWHHPMIALENETDFAVLVHESGTPQDDCQEVDVPEIVVQVPGYHIF
ncbi:Allantoicase [Apophysomyces sp. BC1015]|nr:Allantoicase [Apophysomyces sp. BC1015]